MDHECILGDGVHVMGAAAIAGRVTIEGFASVGTNATVLPDLTVGSGAVGSCDKSKVDSTQANPLSFDRRYGLLNVLKASCAFQILPSSVRS